MPSLSDSINLLALAVSLVALWLTFRELRRSNSVSVGIEEIKWSGQQNLYENGTKMFSVLLVRLRNRGISLHDVQLGLSFRGADGSGGLLAPFPSERGMQCPKGEFARGIVQPPFLTPPGCIDFEHMDISHNE